MKRKMSKDNNSLFHMYEREIFNDYLCQGDIIIGYETEEIPIYRPEKYFKGIIILSFTCDLKHDKIRFLNFCPIFSMEAIFLNKRYIDIIKRRCKTSGKNIENCIRNVMKKRLEDITSNENRDTFYLEEDPMFNDNPCFADLEQIFNIRLNEEKTKNLLNLRKASLRNPWLEKFGYKLGYCFNRVATEDFPEDKLTKLVEKYDNYIKKIAKSFK